MKKGIGILVSMSIGVPLAQAYTQQCYPPGHHSVPFNGKVYTYRFEQVRDGVPLTCDVMLSANDREEIRTAIGSYEAETSIHAVPALPGSITARVMSDLLRVQERDPAAYVTVGDMRTLIDNRRYD